MARSSACRRFARFIRVGLDAEHRADHERFTDPAALDLLRMALSALVTRFATLRLAIPAADVIMRTNTLIYGVHQLSVIWEPPAA